MSKLLNYYIAQDFHLIRLAPEKKIPIANVDWVNEKITLDRAKWWIGKENNGNLGVVCGEQSNGLIVFDYDARPKLTSEIINTLRTLQTLIAFSPRGLHIYFKTKDEVKAREKFQLRIDGKRQEPDKIRWTNGYVVIPPSKVKNGSGELKSYWFLDDTRLPQVIREI